MPLVDPAIADEICEWLSEGKALMRYCAQDGKPKLRTVYDWVEADPIFGARFARARTIGASAMMDLAQAIADDTEHDTIVDEETGRERPNTEWIARSRLRVDTIVRRATAFDPKTFGQRAQVEHAGGISVQVVTGVPPQDAAADVP